MVFIVFALLDFHMVSDHFSGCMGQSAKLFGVKYNGILSRNEVASQRIYFFGEQNKSN